MKQRGMSYQYYRFAGFGRMTSALMAIPPALFWFCVILISCLLAFILQIKSP